MHGDQVAPLLRCKPEGNSNTAPLFAAHTYPDYIPNTNWGPLWGQWYGDNEAGEEPPEWIMELYAIHEDLVSHPPGSEGFISASATRNAWLYENVPFFTHAERPGIVHLWSNCVGNVARRTLCITDHGPATG